MDSGWKPVPGYDGLMVSLGELSPNGEITVRMKDVNRSPVIYAVSYCPVSLDSGRMFWRDISNAIDLCIRSLEQYDPALDPANQEVYGR